MITKKNVNKLQNAVIKENAANLVGAVKLYNALFSNGADLKAICKALEIPAEYAVKVATLAKDKKRLVTVCSQMLPKVDDIFVKFTLYSKVYKDTNVDKEKGIEAKTLIGAPRMWFTVANIKHLVLLLPNHWRPKKVLNG